MVRLLLLIVGQRGSAIAAVLATRIATRIAACCATASSTSCATPTADPEAEGRKICAERDKIDAAIRAARRNGDPTHADGPTREGTTRRGSPSTAASCRW